MTCLLAHSVRKHQNPTRDLNLSEPVALPLSLPAAQGRHFIPLVHTLYPIPLQKLCACTITVKLS